MAKNPAPNFKEWDDSELPDTEKAEPRLTVKDGKVQVPIILKASDCTKNEDGTYTIFVEEVQLSEWSRKLLNQLFPNTWIGIEKLLNTESLMRAIV